MAAQLIMIGCGDFGAAAVACLKERLPSPREVACVALAAQTGSRSGGANVVAGKVAEGWPELAQAMAQVGGGSPLLCLVGFAGEACSGGMLTAALQHLSKAYPRCRRVAWVGLPDSNESGRMPRACAYATLTELEHLRQQGAFERCFLYELPREAGQKAPLFVDAALAYRLMEQGTGTGFKAFGLGVVRDPQQALAQLAPRLALQVAREILGQPQGAAQSAPAETAPRSGLAAVLEQKVAPLLLPTEETGLFRQFRWYARETGGLHVRRWLESPTYADESAKEKYGTWYRDLQQYGFTLGRTLREQFRPDGESIVEGLKRTLEHWAANGSGQPRDAADALDHLEALVRKRLAESEQARRNYGERLEMVEMLHMQPRWAQATRLDMLQALDERDICQSGTAVETVLQSWLEQLLKTTIPIYLRPKVDQVQTKAGRSAQLLEALESFAQTTPPVAGEAAHVLAPALTRELVTQAIAQAETRLVQERVRWALTQSAPANFAKPVVDAAGAALASSTFNPHLPREDRQRRTWVESLLPAIALDEAGAAAARPTQRAIASAKLPADYREDIRERLACPVTNLPFHWPYESEWLVYTDLTVGSLDSLTQLSAWRDSYQKMQTQSSGAYLHALPEPEGGWWGFAAQRTTPGARPAQAKVVQAVALTLVRAIALGLLQPTRDGLTARYLSADGANLVTGTLGSLEETWRELFSNESFRTQLDGQACRWRDQLPPAGLAAYGALLRWISKCGINGADQQQLDSHLRSAAEAECKQVTAVLTELGGYWDKLSLSMAAVVASDLDDFSLAVGDWRYVKW